MPRSSVIVNKLIVEKQLQLADDRAQLASLKQQFIAAPTEYVQKSINAMRQNLANGTEDLDDLVTEIEAINEFEASEAGKLRRAETQSKLAVVDALADVCVGTAHEADKALSAAWKALRAHHAAHQALTPAVGIAYNALVDESGFDIHQDQLFLLRSYSSLSNSGTALTEWIVESLKGFGLDSVIKVEGITLHHNAHETLQAADGVGLGRMWQRLKEIATRCGVEVPQISEEAKDSLRQALHASVMEATKNER